MVIESESKEDDVNTRHYFEKLNEIDIELQLLNAFTVVNGTCCVFILGP